KATLEIRRRVGAERVALTHKYQQRLGGERVEQVPTVEAGRAGADEILLGVVGGAGRVEAVASEVLGVAAGNDGAGQARIDGGEEHGERGAAGLAHGSDARAVYHGKIPEHVETANRIPELEPRGAIAGEEEPAPEPGMFLVGVARLIVGALALAEGIKSEHDVAETDEPLARLLISVVGFSVQAMAHLEKNSGEGRLRPIRQIQVGRDAHAGTALVDKQLDAIAVVGKAAGLVDKERGALRLAADELPKGLANPLLAGAHVVGRLQLCERCLAPLVGLARQGGEIVG